MKRSLGLKVAILVLFGTFLFSQSEDEETIEEFYLQSLEMQIIQEQAKLFDRDMKLLALDNIEELMEEGKVDSEDKEVHYLLDYLSKEGIGHQVRENNRLINNFPIVRKEACTLLGKLGGEDAKESLINLLRVESEPMVLSEAVYQLGVIGLNSRRNETSQAIAEAIHQQNNRNPSDNFAYASLLAFQKIAAINNGLRDPVALSAIITIIQGPYVWRVRAKAQELLKELRQY